MFCKDKVYVFNMLYVNVLLRYSIDNKYHGYHMNEVACCTETTVSSQRSDNNLFELNNITKK